MSTKRLSLGVLLVVLALVPVIAGNPYYLHILTRMFLYIPVTLGVALLARTGQLTFAQSAFLGIGAYTVGILTTKLGWSFWLCLPIAAIVAGIVAIVVGYPTLRVRGPYFAILTFGINEILRLVWVKADAISGGARGLNRIPPPNPLGGWEFGSAISYYYLGLGLMLIVTIALYLASRTHFGLTLHAIGQAETLCDSVGVNTMTYKVKIFVVAAVVAGITGGFYAPLQTYISPVEFTVWNSFDYVVYYVVGGTAAFSGPFYGVSVLTLVPILLQYVPGYNPAHRLLFFGILVLAIIIAYPRGLAYLVQSSLGKISAKTRKPTAVAAVQGD